MDGERGDEVVVKACFGSGEMWRGGAEEESLRREEVP